MSEEEGRMSEEPAENVGDDVQSEQAAAKEKKSRGLNIVVMKEVRRARRLFQSEETAPEANFVISTANVLALVDLAAAIREANHNGNAVPE